jgi:aminoglycoside phosphotransferase (APT) family kinase protein
MDPQLFAQRAADYLRTTLDDPSLEVTRATRIVGGASRHTWSVDLRDDPSGRQGGRGLIFRLDPPASLLESNRRIEYAMYQAMHGCAGVPVPRPILIEDDDGPLGLPFFVMERLGGVAMPHELLRPPLRAQRSTLLHETYAILGRIGSVDPAEVGLDQYLDVPAAGDAWSAQLNQWESVLDRHQLGPMPITRGVIRALRRDPPPVAPRVGVVHGDFRVGNVLFAPDGVVGVLDWEMGHLGDPHEDLAWSFARNWRSATAPDLVGSAIAPAEALAAWESTSGLVADPAALRWWGLFSHVKAAAIWTTAAHEFALGATPDLMLGTMGWFNLAAQERWMLHDLEVLSP